MQCKRMRKIGEQKQDTKPMVLLAWCFFMNSSTSNECVMNKIFHIFFFNIGGDQNYILLVENTVDNSGWVTAKYMNIFSCNSHHRVYEERIILQAE